MNNLNTRKQFIALALGVAISVPAISTAATMTSANNDINPITVSFADLNLSQDKGVETLYSRLKAGAKQSCGTVSARQLNLFRSTKECAETALTDAVDSIGNKKLTELHSS
ncbi:MAG: UrcA family protein [Gammaproteobacteria bacterium]|nr:UrcA family protein [Gammaproteobacteria bacterium]